MSCATLDMTIYIDASLFAVLIECLRTSALAPLTDPDVLLSTDERLENSPEHAQLPEGRYRIFIIARLLSRGRDLPTLARPTWRSEKRRLKIAITAYLLPAQAVALRSLSERTGMSQAALLREAVDLLLAHYKGT
jgi:hypothetical protein